jgi:hypothetical protein
MKVLFATKCWGGDYTKFLSGTFKRKIPRYPFTECWLFLNNAVPSKAFRGFSADKIIEVDDYAERTLNFFKLDKKDFNGGYVYSIAELVCLYLAKSFDYLCWIQGDCLMEDSVGFVGKSIKVLEKKPHISIVSPRSEVNTWHNDLGLDQFCSDQGFVVRIKEFRQPIYNYKMPTLNQYPSHGGNSFERLVGRYLRNNNKFRRILNEYYLFHPAY